MTSDIIPNDVDKGFENTDKTICNMSFLADNHYSSNTNLLDEAPYYHSYCKVKTIPILKPEEKIGHVE